MNGLGSEGSIPTLHLALRAVSRRRWNEALHGVAISEGVVFAAPTPCATSFPQARSALRAHTRRLQNGSALCQCTCAAKFPLPPVRRPSREVLCLRICVQVIGTSSSWNATLWHRVADAIATEARAFSNVGHAGLTFWCGAALAADPSSVCKPP